MIEHRRNLARRLVVVATAATLAATPAASGAGNAPHNATIDPAAFVKGVDNPWYPLQPGTTYVYRGFENGRPSRSVTTVTSLTKAIIGVRCIVVRDNVYIAGRLAERTADWFAQDTRGNVWYFGEATAELDSSGRVTTTQGSWQAGVDGAQPGIVMPASPRVGQAFRQEYYKGHAEDHFGIESLSTVVRVPYVSSARAMRTREWTPLEPGLVEHKYYVRGIGLVKDGSAELVTVARP